MRRMAFGIGSLLLISLSTGALPVQQPGPGARNIILFIGDGLGQTQLALALLYASQLESRKLHLQALMEQGETGYALPVPFAASVIDSAASAAQIATGVEARNETLGIDPDGRPLETILEWAEKKAMWTGLVTNMRISHATPAAFASHQISRYTAENEAAAEMISGHEIEVLLGGGIERLIPKGRRATEVAAGLPPELDGTSRRTDERNLLEEARSRGYALATDRASLREAAESATRLLGLFASSHLPYVLDRRGERLREVPSLPELAGAALAVLSQSRQGFFLMVEGGRIDYAGHDNDPGTMLHEILEFDEALGVALRFREEHPETLIVVTADHGTGGFSLTYGRHQKQPELLLPAGQIYRSRWRYPGLDELKLIGGQTASYLRILERAAGDPAKLKDEVRRGTGLELSPVELAAVLARNAEGQAETCDFKEFYVDEESAPQCLLARALARQNSVVWSTGGHTIEPVATFGAGPGAAGLRGVYPNTKIHAVLKEAIDSGR